MTTFEHALLAGNATAAVGLHRQFGHTVLLTAAIAGLSPDWDGLTFLWDIHAFSRGHRVWGHGLPVAVVVGAVVAVTDAASEFSEKTVGRLARLDGMPPLSSKPLPMGVAAGVGASAAATHIPADVIVSGGKNLFDWPVAVLWPFEGPKLVYPMLRWGDPGPTLIFAAGLIVGVKQKWTAERTARLTLGLLFAYLVIGRLRILANA